MTEFRFDDKQIARLREAERKNADVLELVRKAKNCGIPCEMYEQTATANQEQLKKMREEFGPKIGGS